MARRAPKPVNTARGVALVRAMEMTRPAARRITEDPYAAAFVDPLRVWGMRLMTALGVLRLIGIEPMLNFALLRERFIADRMAREAEAGLGQVVILGAGFDTRAYRLPGLAAIPVYEVDHPATQAKKREALAGAAAPLPPNLRFVAVDFNVDDLGTRLLEAGYDPALRTLFVWQGVIMYLSLEGIDHTLGFIARQSPPRSVVVFDYMTDAALSHSRNTMLRLSTNLMGETLRFTLSPAALRPFLEARGFTAVDQVDHDALARLYPADGRRLAPDAAIAWASVAPRP